MSIIPPFRTDPEVERTRTGLLKEHRRSRPAGPRGASMKEVRKAAEGKENLVPVLVGAVEAGVTLGEICGVLREVFGEEPTREMG